VSFPRPLTKGTVVHSMVGHIDANKIYRFRIGLTEPNGNRTSAEVEFSADDCDSASPGTGPRYRLNSHAALTRFIGDEVDRRPSPVQFTVAESKRSTGASGEQSVPEGTLLAERNALLIAMSGAWGDVYVGDKYLSTRMRATLSQLQMLQITPGTAPSEQPHLE